jgi:NADPH2:quinone reductase
MKAIRFAQYGEPAKVLTVQECPLPEPGKGEVRVRMLASPVNPSDLLFVRGQYAGVQPHFPSPVGFEGVGMVDALGPQVQRPVPGQRVVVRNEKGGNWADYAVVPAQDLLAVPDDLPDEQAACFTVNPASAILMLRHVLAIPKGEWLLQSAASGELGRMIIRLAKHDGIRMAGETGTQMYQALGEEGRMLVYGSLTGEPIRVGADPRFILAGRRILEVFWVAYWLHRLDETAQRQLVQEIVTLMREGILTTSAARPFPLDEIGTAVTQAETTGRQGKTLLVPQNGS